jgi:hypothetical protein
VPTVRHARLCKAPSTREQLPEKIVLRQKVTAPSI